MAAVPGILRKWNPGIIPGLRVWYDGSDSASMTFSSGCNIQQMNDKSGHLNHNLIQMTPSNQPFLNGTINGLPSISFNSSNNMYLSTMHAVFPNSLNNNNFTQFSVARISGDVNNAGTAITNLTNSNNTIFSYPKYINKGTRYFYFYNQQLYIPYVVVPNIAPANYLVENFYNINNNFVGINYSNTTTIYNNTPVGFFSNLSVFTLGTQYPDSGQKYLNVGEVLYYSNYLFYSNSPYQNNPYAPQVEGYLAWKWGLTPQLSNGHPYKNRAPT